MPYRWASPARYKIQRGHRAHAGETGLHNAHFVFVSPTRSTQVRIPVAEICGRTIPWSQQCLSILDVAKLADNREAGTVAILAQGTSWAVAVTQAFLLVVRIAWGVVCMHALRPLVERLPRRMQHGVR